MESEKKQQTNKEKMEKEIKNINIKNSIIIYSVLAFLILLFGLVVYTRRRIDIIERQRPSLISIQAPKVKLSKETKQAINYTILPQTIKDDNLVWKSTNPDVAFFSDNNNIYTKSLGTTVIYAELNGIKSNELTIEVVNYLEKIEVLDFPDELKQGEKHIIKVNYIPKDAINKNISIETSDAKIATVADNTILALTPGDVVITFKDDQGAILLTKSIKINPLTEILKNH